MRKHCIPIHNWIGPLILLLIHAVSGEQQAEDHRIQRRFMWQQMDNSVMGGLMGRMFKGPARAMKSMFGDFMPSTSGYAKNMMDFLPTETTRVKYIIRDPHTNKPMKIIKMRGAHKKLVKMMRPLPKPAVTEPTMLQYENRMRQLEKEQEMIVEGKVPISSDEALMDKYFKPQKAHPNSNEIVSGKIMEYQSWKPVYKSGEQPTSFVTLRPQPMTRLHTNIAAGNENHGNYELLPKPEKLVSHRPNLEENEDEDDDFEQVEETENELLKHKGHQYEVTEHTGEASGEIHALAAMEGGFVPSHVYQSNPSPNLHTHADIDTIPHILTHSNPHSHTHTNPHTHTNLNPLPSQSPRPRSRYSSNANAPSTTASTTTTTEPPNYPAGFLQKFREREQERERERETSKSHNKSRSKHHHREHINNKENAETISFSMSSLRARLQEQQRQSKQEEHNAEMEAALEDVMQGDKWPADVEVQQGGSYLTSPIGPSAVAFEQPFKSPRSEYKRQRKDLRQRGSIKFSDNPNAEEM